MNSQWEMEIETITKNLDYLKYLPLIDKGIMTDLRNDYEKQSLKKTTFVQRICKWYSGRYLWN